MPVNIFALDIAVQTGFAYGEPETRRPTSGSVRFASQGASHEAVFAAALSWATKIFRETKPSLIVWEAPLPTSFAKGVTNVKTTSLLFGLPAVIGAVAYLVGCHDLRTARTSDVRRHFIGSNPKGERGKQLTVRRCREIGWDTVDNNEADALATWGYMAEIVNQQSAMWRRPLFSKAVA